MSITVLAPSSACVHIGHMSDASEVIREVFDLAPGSIRELAREAGVSHGLLVAVKNGQRRLTPATKAALVQVLRTWADRCTSLASKLEEVGLSPGGSDE